MKVHYVPEDEYNLPWTAYVIAALVLGACVGYGFGLGNGAERERKHLVGELERQYGIQSAIETEETVYEFPLPDNFAPSPEDLQALLMHISTSTVFTEKEQISNAEFEMPPAQAAEPSIEEAGDPKLETSASPFWILKDLFNSL